MLNPAGDDPRRIHSDAIIRGVSPTPRNIDFFNKLITLYSAADLQSSSLRLFLSIPCPNAVTFTSIISAFSESPPAAVSLFRSMLRHPRRPLPNPRTFAVLLKTCAAAAAAAIAVGPQLHSLSLKLASYDNPFVGSALVSLYCKTPDADSARQVFDEMSGPDGFCYAAVINGLARNDRPLDALGYFSEMRNRDVGSSFHSVSGALRAASTAAMLDQCTVIHGHAAVIGMDSETHVGTALIDAYGKCGLVDDARKLFHQLEDSDHDNLAAWNSIMAAYAQQGDHQTATELFTSMETRKLNPDPYTFLAILTALCNASMAAETQTWLEAMKSQYAMEPHIQHYTCLVAALARSGRSEEAENLVLSMPHEPDAAVWRTLLSAEDKNPERALRISEKLLEINPNDDSAYVILANALSRAGRTEEVRRVRKAMRETGVRKDVGRSWIEVRGTVHAFFSGDARHPRNGEIRGKVAELRAKVGEESSTGEDDDGGGTVWEHSERLAVAFGLLEGVTPAGKVVRVVKNLRMCGDCHVVFQCISRVEEREILVRDAHRYHRFCNGRCTCGDSW
ncbi:hypothetical protein M569_09375 [Genlisea aurea]|uniref:DYW domain-containing protein n=1 Tax=Genlisea aurea TaxID=192259 RepID=S8DZG0_9LAMI|nr:hypothetical protein M569_09375 [Genlisea aurea]